MKELLRNIWYVFKIYAIWPILGAAIGFLMAILFLLGKGFE